MPLTPDEEDAVVARKIEEMDRQTVAELRQIILRTLAKLQEEVSHGIAASIVYESVRTVISEAWPSEIDSE